MARSDVTDGGPLRIQVRSLLEQLDTLEQQYADGADDAETIVIAVQQSRAILAAAVSPTVGAGSPPELASC